MPKIALAPLLLVWFGFGLGSKIAVAAVISLFPVLVNTIAGLRNCDAGRLDVLRALGASRWDCFRLVKLPNALPFVFSGLSAAVMFALTGALVGEFVGSSAGLGYLIVQANNSMDIPQVFVFLLVLVAIGLGAFAALQMARRKFLFSNSSGGSSECSIDMSVSSSPTGSKATLTTLSVVGSGQLELAHVKRSRRGRSMVRN